MIRIAALNDSSDEDDSRDVGSVLVGTKEAKEAEAFTLYNKALTLQRQGQITQAEQVFEELLDHEFIVEASKLVEDGTEGSVHPGLQLLYSIYKNMATMALHRGDNQAAMKSYIEAVKIDESEVTVWYKMGTIALKLVNYPLARLGFEQGLQCNPNHWPCLDNVITVLYTINDYWNCLYYISRALEKDYMYTKGLVIRNQIYKEQPSLKEDSKEFFVHCHPSIHMYDIEKEEADQFIQEALDMRLKRKELAKVPDPLPITLPNTIKLYTWKCLGESLLSLYDSCKNANPPKSLGLRVDLSDYADITVEKAATLSTQENIKVSSEESVEEKMDTIENNEVVPCQNLEQPPATVTDVVMETEAKQEENVATVVPSVTVLDDVTPQMSTMSPSASMTTISASAALQDHPCSSPVDFKDSAGRGRPTKRKRGLFEEDFGVKRRSARVRNTYNRRKEEETTVNFQELLLAFLPSSLKQALYDDDMDAKATENAEQAQEDNASKVDPEILSQPSAAVSVFTSEEKEVIEFLKNNQKNSGTIVLMMDYLFYLANKRNIKWPAGLAEIFLQVYSRIRKHFDLPNLYGNEETEEYIQDLAKTCLVSAELQLDFWMVKKSRMIGSPGNSPRSPSHGVYLQMSDLPEYCMDDLWYITGLTPRSDLLGDYWIEHSIRTYWMKARLSMLQGEVEEALYSFQQTINYLEFGKENYSVTEIQLPNCEMDNIISPDQVKRQQESLQRYQSSEETQKLFDSGNFEKVVEFLLQTFEQRAKSKVVSLNTGIPERQAQLLLLQESLFKLGDCQKALLWGEVSFNEAVQCYKRASTSILKEEWSSTIAKLCSDLIRVTDKDSNVLSTLPSTNTMRLTQNLVYLIDVMMSVLEGTLEIPLGTVLPWILLYKLIKQEEDKFKAMKIPESPTTGSGDFDNAIPSSLMLLNIAHDYLGRLSWCTKSDGALLLFFIDVLQEVMSSTSSAFKEELEQAFEQCIFCLYGHPNKKGKARHLLDHNAPLIHMVWDRATVVFEYFKPKTVPEFDGYKQDTVSGEVAVLLKRIAHLVPVAEKPSHHIDNVLEYIEGNTNTPPNPNTDNISPVPKEIYYLLADYYFKNKEQSKAIKFYLCDICVNPQRLDSWAGMALARMSQLEQKLNAMELKLDVQLYKKSISALRCFKRAMEIDKSNSKLWIEYGSLAYQLHSHSSRQLKMYDWFPSSFPLNEELLQISTDSRQEMLQTAFNCYKKATECDTEEHEDEWLQHYMMGKCLEKLKKPPVEYLRQYKQASARLHEENATYPRRINYSYTSPHLAVEALEMFYRLHVSAVKQILKNNCTDVDCWDFQKFLDEAAYSPFTRCREKRHEKPDDKESSLSAFSDDLSQSLPGFIRKPKSQFSSQDHTYSKQKSVLISSDADSSVDLNLYKQPSELVEVQSREPKSSGVIELSAEPASNDSSQIIDSSVVQVAKKPSVTSCVDKGNVRQTSKPLPFSMASILGETDSYKTQTEPGQTSISKQKSLGFDVQQEPVELCTSENNLKDNMVSKSNEKSDFPLSVSDSRNNDASIKSFSDDYQARKSDAQLSALENDVKKGNKTQNACISSPASTTLIGESMKDESKSDVIEIMSSPEPCELKSQSLQSKEICAKEKITENAGLNAMEIFSSPDTTSVTSNIINSSANDTTQGKIEVTEQTGPDVIAMDTGSEVKSESQHMLSTQKMDTEWSEQRVNTTEGSVAMSKDETNMKDEIKYEETDYEKNGENKMEEHKMDTDEGKSCEIKNENKNEFDNENKAVLKPSVNIEMIKDEIKMEHDTVSENIDLDRDQNLIEKDKISDLEGVDNESKIVSNETSDPNYIDKDKINEVRNDYKNADDESKTIKREIMDPNYMDEDKMSGTKDSETKKDIVMPSIQNMDGKVEENKKKEDVTEKDEVSKIIDEMIHQIEKDPEINDENIGIKAKQDSVINDDGQIVTRSPSGQVKSGVDSSQTCMESLNDKIKSGQCDVDSSEHQNKSENYDKNIEQNCQPVDNQFRNVAIVDLTEVDVENNDLKSVNDGVDLGKEKEKLNMPYMSNKIIGQNDQMDINKKAETDQKNEAMETDSENPRKKQLTGGDLRRDILEKCITAFHLCVCRFPTHYKSLYRLAYIYYSSPYHKNLQFARDMLLGTSKWSHLNHMPGQGLFGERKQNNFFQGIWRIPIEEIDRSGSFATHLNRSVDLLLKVLLEMKDVSMLYYIHLQMSRSPDSGKKYLRDGERSTFARLSFSNCLDAIITKVPDVQLMGDKDKQMKYLLEVYKIWNHGISKLRRHVARLNKAFTSTYEAVRKKEINPDLGVLDQAMKFCQNYQHQQSVHTRSQHPSGGKTSQDGGSSQSDSSIFSPERQTSQTSLKVSPPEKNLLMSMLMSPTGSQSSSPLSSISRPVSQSALTSPMGSQSSFLSPASSNQGTSRYTSVSSTPEQQNKPSSLKISPNECISTVPDRLNVQGYLASVNQSSISTVGVASRNLQTVQSSISSNALVQKKPTTVSSDNLESRVTKSLTTTDKTIETKASYVVNSNQEAEQINSDRNKDKQEVAELDPQTGLFLDSKSETSPRLDPQSGLFIESKLEAKTQSENTDSGAVQLDPETGLFVNVPSSPKLESEMSVPVSNIPSEQKHQQVSKPALNSEVESKCPQSDSVFKTRCKDSVSDYDLPVVVTPKTPRISDIEKFGFEKSKNGSDMKITVVRNGSPIPQSCSLPKVTSSALDIIEILSSSDEENEADEADGKTDDKNHEDGGGDDGEEVDDDDDDSIPSSIDSNMSESDEEEPPKPKPQPNSGLNRSKRKSGSDDECFDPSYQPSSDGSESESDDAAGAIPIASVITPSIVMESPSEFCAVQQPPRSQIEAADSDSQNSTFVANPEHLYFDINELMDLDD